MAQATRTCSIDECGKPVDARGWCKSHWERWRRWGDPTHVDRRSTRGICAVDDCDSLTKSATLCDRHYRADRRQPCRATGCDSQAKGTNRYCDRHRGRLRRHGQLELPPKATSTLTSEGYRIIRVPGHPLAQVSRGGQWILEHRAVLYGAIGPGEHDCHWCAMRVAWERQYPQHRDALVVDHLDTDRLNNEAANLVPSCAPCNSNRR